MGERDEYLRGCRDLCGWKSQLVQKEGLVMPSLPGPPLQNLLGHNKGTGMEFARLSLWYISLLLY